MPVFAQKIAGGPMVVNAGSNRATLVWVLQDGPEGAERVSPALRNAGHGQWAKDAFWAEETRSLEDDLANHQNAVFASWWGTIRRLPRSPAGRTIIAT
jgi:hypothetical protein